MPHLSKICHDFNQILQFHVRNQGQSCSIYYGICEIFILVRSKTRNMAQRLLIWWEIILVFLYSTCVFTCMGFIIVHMADRSSGGGVISSNIFLTMHLLFRKTYDHQIYLKQDRLSVSGSETGRQTFVTLLVVSLLRTSINTKPHIRWENSVQLCTTELWLNQVLWGSKKPSRNYQRLGISLLPGIFKFSFSFKVRALWRMEEGFPLQGQLLSPAQLLCQPTPLSEIRNYP